MIFATNSNPSTETWTVYGVDSHGRLFSEEVETPPRLDERELAERLTDPARSPLRKPSWWSGGALILKAISERACHIYA